MDFVEYFNVGTYLSAYISALYPTIEYLYEILIAIAFGLAGYGIVYAFQAIALYTIGKRNGYGHLWMAFVPFMNTYYLGVVSDKNKIFNAKAKYFSMSVAILEFLLVAGFILYYVSAYVLDGMGYILSTESVDAFGLPATTYYVSSTTPASMAWMAWCYNYLSDILYYIQLVYLFLNVFVLIAFFQTYAHGRYFIMALFSALLPIAGVIMFCVRKNKPMNYAEFMRRQQEQRYRQYQRNQQYGNPYNYNPYNGNPNNYGNPDQGQNSPNNNNNNGGSPAPDPFDEFNSNTVSGAATDNDSDPFEDF